MNVKIVSGFLIVAAAIAQAGDSGGANWPSFRGLRASGVAEGFETAEKWDVPKGENVKWKAPIPGLGHSGPVIWENQLFVTTAVKEGDAELKVGLYGDIEPVNEQATHRWQTFCLDKRNGNVLWKQTAREGVPKVKRHPKSSHANSTPATDGKHVVSFFGSEGLYCYSVAGKLLWSKDLGVLDSGYFRVPTAQWGFASSPIIHHDLLIVQCDVQKGSFLAAFDVSNGNEIWRTPREEVPTWSTPTVVANGGRDQVVVNGFKHIGAYDARTGKELWKLQGGGDIPVPTPVFAHHLIFITSAHGRMAPVYAIRPDARGDISLPDNQSTNDFVAWSMNRRGNYMQTPIVVGDYLYCCNDAGVLACYNARTGENLYSERLGTGGAGFTASAVSADGRLYGTSEQGTVYVIRAGPKFEVLGKNEMGETCMATPAISEGVLYFRTRGNVVAIGREGSTRAAP